MSELRAKEEEGDKYLLVSLVTKFNDVFSAVGVSNVSINIQLMLASLIWLVSMLFLGSLMLLASLLLLVYLMLTMFLLLTKFLWLTIFLLFQLSAVAGGPFKLLDLCRWFRFAQLAKGKKFRP